MQMAAQHEDMGLQVLGITDAPAADARRFVVENSLPFPVLADAAETRVAFQIDMIWGSPVFLLDESGSVVAEELGPVESYLSTLAEK